MSILKYKDPKTGEFKRINPYKAELSFVGKDGITIDKAANSEKIEISGSGCVQKGTSPFTVYGTDGNGNALNRRLTANPVPNAVAQYSNSGRLSTDTPINDLNCTNKKYVDDNYVAKVKFTNLEQALNGYILDTTKEAYADLDSAVLKNSVAIGDNVYPIADKTRALVTRIEGKTTKMVQLLKNGDFSQGTDNWSKFSAAVNNISFEVVDNSLEVTALTGGTGGDIYMVTQRGMQTSVVGHKYLILVTAKIMQGEGITGFSYEGYATFTRLVKIDNTNLYYAFITATKADDWYGLKPFGTKAVGDKWSFSNCQCFDLTAMNREDITSVEQFKAEFPDLYPYENGNIYPAKISGVKFYEKQDKSGEQASVTLPETYDLHGIGDYKDYLEITKNEDNELYTLKKIQRIEKKVLDGTETINKSGYSTDNHQGYYVSIALYSYNNGVCGICNKLPTATQEKNIAHITFGINNVYPYLFFDKETYATVDSVKAYLAAQYAANDPLIIYYIRQKPVETVIATNLTYEQVTAIRRNGGLIEVVGNANKGYARPTIKNTIVYRLTATNTAEG